MGLDWIGSNCGRLRLSGSERLRANLIICLRYTVSLKRAKNGGRRRSGGNKLAAQPTKMDLPGWQRLKQIDGSLVWRVVVDVNP